MQMHLNLFICNFCKSLYNLFKPIIIKIYRINALFCKCIECMKYFKTIKIKNFPIICNIPHASLKIPKKFLNEYLLPKDELKKETTMMADLFADELYSPLFKKYGALIATVSRILIDTERFADDRKEKMSKIGMGVTYTRTGTGEKLRNITAMDKKELINEIYIPYHKEMEGRADECLKKFGRCLILDCHTFPSTVKKYDLDKRIDRPDICIGTDKFHTPKKLENDLIKVFGDAGFTVSSNRPFQGSIVPLKFYKKNRNIFSVMIEINRRMYMDEKKFIKKPGFPKFSGKICNLIEKTCQNFLDRI
jgi:N-formylglutamate deformylase